MWSTGQKPVQANHLRILLLVINLAVAATLPVMYAWGMSSDSTSEPHPPAVDLDDYVYRPLPEPPPVDLTKIVEGLLPKRPQPPDPLPSTPVTPPGPSPRQGGPLAEEWQYVFYMRTDDGRVNLVKLKRIRKGPSPGPRSGRSVPSRSRRPTGRSSSRRAPERIDSVVLFVQDRVVQDPVFGIGFLIDSADGETFKYVLPADRTKVYSLPFMARRDSPKDKRYFVPAGWKKMVETEYQRWKSGKLELSEATTLNP